MAALVESYCRGSTHLPVQQGADGHGEGHAGTGARVVAGPTAEAQNFTDLVLPLAVEEEAGDGCGHRCWCSLSSVWC